MHPSVKMVLGMVGLVRRGFPGAAEILRELLKDWATDSPDKDVARMVELIALEFGVDPPGNPEEN